MSQLRATLVHIWSGAGYALRMSLALLAVASGVSVLTVAELAAFGWLLGIIVATMCQALRAHVAVDVQMPLYKRCLKRFLRVTDSEELTDHEPLRQHPL